MRWLMSIFLIFAVLAAAYFWNAFQEIEQLPGDAPVVDLSKDPDRVAKARALLDTNDLSAEELATLPVEEIVGLLKTDQACRVVLDAIDLKEAEALSPMIALMSDPAARRPLSEEIRRNLGMDFDESMLLEPLVKWFWNHPDPALVPVVAALVRDRNDNLRQSAARLLGLIADDACIGPLAVSLRDGDSYVRSSAEEGIHTAVKEGRGSAAFRAAMFDLVLPNALILSDSFSGDAPRALLVLDRARAIEILTLPPYLATENPVFSAMLDALHDEGVLLDERVLHSLLEDANLPGQDESGLLRCRLIPLLAMHDTPTARAAIHSLRDDPDPDIRETVQDAVLAYAGLKEPVKVAYRKFRENDHDLDGLAAPVRNVLLCRFFINQVNNGGISQWFVNGYGREWKRTLAAFKAIGAVRSHEILSKALTKFGPSGPPSRGLDDAVVALHKDVEDPWDAEDREFFKDEDGIESLLLKYMLEHKPHFVDEAASQPGAAP